jgi:hypothetical protein
MEAIRTDIERHSLMVNLPAHFTKKNIPGACFYKEDIQAQNNQARQHFDNFRRLIHPNSPLFNDWYRRHNHHNHYNNQANGHHHWQPRQNNSNNPGHPNHYGPQANYNNCPQAHQKPGQGQNPNLGHGQAPGQNRDILINSHVNRVRQQGMRNMHISHYLASNTDNPVLTHNRKPLCVMYHGAGKCNKGSQCLFNHTE